MTIQMRATRTAAFLFMFIAVLFTQACTQHEQVKNDINKLSERLESFTELSIDGPQLTDHTLKAPAKSSLEQVIPDLQIAMREFYAIDDCPLGQFIAERNTALGKTQLPSTRFLYEKRLLNTLHDCMQQLQNEHPMHEKLASWIAQKQDNLPLVWVNMLTQSDELYLAFTTSGGFIAGTSEDGLQETKLALNYLLEALEANSLNSEQLELHMRDLTDTRLPARMWRTQNLIVNSLPAISKLLERYIDEHANQCATAKLEEELTIMRNIFTLFFADTIQPLASQLNHYQYQLNPSFELLANNQYMPPQWSQFIREQYVESADEYKQTMKKHIELWQAIFRLCDDKDEA
ncbi:DUF3080 family protein [Glaciecola siphonariae]|uniref:DUF3080 family protein n=1 Tax=Glaciecola siphonariae TaxID=521012 RepID=A0ABV9LSQ7_9ALTE